MLSLLVLGGCNPWFDLEKTHPVDAALDAPDAPPPMCPAIGAGPPMFAQDPIVFGAMHCVSYTTSAVTGTAVASCDSGLVEGPIGTSAFTALTVTTTAGYTLTSPRLSPGGDQLYAIARPPATGTAREVQRLRRIGTSAFEIVDRIPFSPFEAGLLDSVSAPSATTEPHVIVHLFDSGGTSTFVELHEKTGGWSEDRRETLAQAGTGSMAFPSLSPDGLRLVFAGSLPGVGGAAVLYRERSSVTDPFGPPVVITGTDPNRLWPHLPPDCSRMYFSRVDALEYVGQ
jgi:hypothetical protein